MAPLARSAQEQKELMLRGALEMLEGTIDEQPDVPAAPVSAPAIPGRSGLYSKRAEPEPEPHLEPPVRSAGGARRSGLYSQPREETDNGRRKPRREKERRKPSRSEASFDFE